MVREEDYFSDDKKLSRIERKRLSKKDRSKYKKTDRDKVIPTEKPEGMTRGRVLSISSEGIIVDVEGKNILCSLRGALKKEKTLAKNLVAVGDFVHIDFLDDQGAIHWVEPRKSTLSRSDNLSRLKEHVIAANIDQVFIVTSLKEPPLKPVLIDRYVIAALKGAMVPIVVINKIDRLDELTEEEREIYEALCEGYLKTQIQVVGVSATKGLHIDTILKMMEGKASVFSGQSGVGKSSLINAVTGLDLQVGQTVKRTQKGAHTTSKAELFRMQCGGFCIDTPGVQSFGLWNLEKEEVQHYFEEILNAAKDCKFLNCTHTHEPECAVQAAVERGEIAPLRFLSYQTLLQDLEEEHKRR